MIKVVGIRFQRAGKIYYFDPLDYDLETAMHVIVETARGIEMGTVLIPPKEVDDDKVVQPLKPVIRIATDDDEKVIEKNKEKEERNFQSELKDVIEFYENNITLITSFISEDMEKYLKSGLYADLIIEAMKEAVCRNKRSWKYVASILNDCINNKVYTAKQFRIRQEEFKSNKTQTHQSNKSKEKIEYKEVELTEEQYNKMMNERGKKYE